VVNAGFISPTNTNQTQKETQKQNFSSTQKQKNSTTFIDSPEQVEEEKSLKNT